MTAILGFNCTNGILLFSDTEISYSSGTKSEGDKLRTLTPPNGIIITGSSGVGPDIDYANFRLEQDLLQRPALVEKEVYKELQDLAQGIARDCGRWLNIDMLLGIRPLATRHASMYRWCGELIYPIHPEANACTGAGEIQLSPLLRHIGFPADHLTMLWYGIKLMLEAKRMVQGVGGRTDALFLEHGTSRTIFGSDNIQRIEQLVIQVERFENTLLIPFVSGVGKVKGGSPSEPLAVNEFLERIRSEYEELLKPLVPQTSKDQQ